MIVHADDDGYLRAVGERVRGLRARRGLTRRSLAGDSGVSERYLAQLEAGQGNASLLIIRQLARALGVSPEELIAEGETHAGNDAVRRGRIALIGLRGAGKTTLGTYAAERLGVPFVELDREVERAAGVSLATIFEIYGQDRYRRYERECLEHVLASVPCFVVAAGGSIVSERETFERLLSACFTAWLSAAPAEHMARVIAQGDMRPMAGNREAMQDLQRILAEREPLYRRADVEISTSGKPVDESLDALLGAIAPGARRQAC